MPFAWPEGARLWSADEIAADAAISRDLFRRRRAAEPMQTYLETYADLEGPIRDVVDGLGDLFADPIDPAYLASLVSDERLFTALRYLAAPPISADDLDTLAGFSVKSRVDGIALADAPERAKAVLDIIRQVLDPKRFPWILEGRAPRRDERATAILATTVVAAGQRVQTSRRSADGRELETEVRAMLSGISMIPVTLSRTTPRQDPTELPRGHFTQGPCLFGDDQADILARMHAGRWLAVECKSSNSEINSRKRLNKEAAKNAQNWYGRFGRDTVVAAAVIQGVFKPGYVQEAQATPLAIVWGHRIGDLRDLIVSAMPAEVIPVTQISNHC
jgi:hypothetical protein